MAVLHRPVIESAHWYSGNGEPVHTRPTTEGNPRPTTLADARKLGLFPSVTGILSILAKHGLEKWKIKQVLLAMKRTKQQAKEADEPYYDRVITEAFAQVDTASTAGSGLHAAIMCALQGRPFEEHFAVYVERVFAFLERAKIEPRTTEQTLVNHKFGFAGTMDFAGIRGGYLPMVLDWKTRKTQPGRPIQSYEGQPMQISAYGATYWENEWMTPGGVAGGNIYISSTEPGRIEMVPYDPARMRREFESFKACADIWRHLNGYDPRIAGSAADEGESEIQGERYHNVIIGYPDLPEETLPLTSLIPKADAPAPARTTVPTPAKRQKDGKKAQDTTHPVEITNPKGEVAKGTLKISTETGKVVPGSIKVEVDKKKAAEKYGPPKLLTIGFGRWKDTHIHNVPVDELEKLQKFCKKQLAERPAVAQGIKRFLDGLGQQAAKKHTPSKKK